MGTRSLIIVISREGRKKVAQYGHSEGYPSRVGVGVLNFLKNKEVFDKFKSNLSRVRFLDECGIDEEFIESYDKNAGHWSDETDNRTEEQKHWFSNYGSSELAEAVLTNIANSTDEEILLMDRAIDFGCFEYSYIININKHTLEIYGQIDQVGQEPMKVYKLHELPEEDVFLSDLNSSC